MPRLPRINLEGAIYYVTCRGQAKQEIFADGADYQMYLDLIAKTKKQREFKLFSYCLLGDSLHLLIETGRETSISQVMHDLNSLYTKYFNSRHHKRGHLFESRFRSVLVEKSQHLLEMTRFIHRLPEGYAQVPFSSLTVYVQPSADPLGIRAEVGEVLAVLAGGDYSAYCAGGSLREIGELEKRLRRGSVLGSESFTQRVKERAEERVQSMQTPARPVRLPLLVAGGAVLLATAAATYLYISREALETQYATLLQAKEREYAQKTWFENRSPLALTNLDQTVWQVELIPTSGRGEIVRDRIRFEKGQFISEALSAMGFGPAAFVLKPGEGGMVWLADQAAPTGSQAAWRGEWKGDALKGTLELKPAVGKPQSFSFFSVQWSYRDDAK